MWLINSSIGRKFVMSISGIVLVLFLLFHLSMNVTAVFSAEAYNTICALLGANWYAVAGTVVIAGIIAIHFTYALILTLANRRARGKSSYKVNARPKGVSWASQNMFVIGLVVVCFMILHFSQFWYKMMFAEIIGHHEIELCNGSTLSPQDGAGFVAYYFSHLWVVVAYLVWYVALWFHLTHGVWSAIQTVGFNNELWLKRWKAVAYVVATLVFLGFAFVTLYFYALSLFGGGCC
ncbi:MAG: succinate dehydrogenase cytochrome b subunit [Tannerella sp.]|jgi:succinate dehydrogenase / fumarate reductase cytochrome b subunit|nr:succinate dehydrogenase cytochrome b subunit [Tannerella sp.]